MLISVANVVATAFAQTYGAADEETWKGVNEDIDATYERFARGVRERFVPKYGRSQETEADIIAYRFLEWSGIGGEAYIETLKIIAPRDDSDYDSKSDHPRTSERIALLEYMGDKYPLYNWVNLSLLQRYGQMNNPSFEIIINFQFSSAILKNSLATL